MKRILALVLAGVMLLSVCVFAEEATTEETMTLEEKETEITSEAETGYYEAYELKKLGIMNGDPDGNMRLDDEITRAEAVALIARLYKLYGKDVENQAAEFNDIKMHWAYGEIQYAKNAKLIDKTDELAFEPERSITYSEFIKMALTVLGYDVMAEEMGGYPHGYIMVAADMSVIDGMNFRIDDNITRAMAAKMLLNVVDLPIMIEMKTESGDKKYVLMNGDPVGEYVSLRTMTENK